MIIVSNTSPINNLAAINQLHLLHKLYGTVLIPESVYRELTHPSFSVSGATEVQTLDWIQTRSASDHTIVEVLSSELDVGEAEAIALALEIKADQVLIDERRGRLVAASTARRKFGNRRAGILPACSRDDCATEGWLDLRRRLLGSIFDTPEFWEAWLRRKAKV